MVLLFAPDATYTRHHAGRIKTLIVAVITCWSVRWHRCWGAPGWCCWLAHHGSSWTTCRQWLKKRHGWTTHWLQMIDRGTCWWWTNHRCRRTAWRWWAEQWHGLTTHWWCIHRCWRSIGHVWHDGWWWVWLRGQWSQRHISDSFLHTWYKMTQFQHSKLQLCYDETCPIPTVLLHVSTTAPLHLSQSDTVSTPIIPILLQGSHSLAYK